MKRLLFALLLLVAGMSQAQIKFEGVVRDTTQTPLELANVIAINQETSAMASYGITDAQGRS